MKRKSETIKRGKAKEEKVKSEKVESIQEIGDDPYQPHLGTQIHYYRCSLPGLAEFVVSCCEGTDKGHHNTLQFKLCLNADGHYADQKNKSKSN